MCLWVRVIVLCHCIVVLLSCVLVVVPMRRCAALVAYYCVVVLVNCCGDLNVFSLSRIVVLLCLFGLVFCGCFVVALCH